MSKPTNNTGEPRLASVASWAVLTASFGLSASTWVALAVLAGFTGELAVPVLGVTLRLAWLMPIAVDGYVVVALVLWMSTVPARVAAFAKRNTYGAAGIGIAAQSAYHLLFTASTTDQTWRVVLAAIVGALPPAVAGLAVHMRALIRRESGKPATDTTTTTTATVAVTVPTQPVPTLPVPTLSTDAQPMLPARPEPVTAAVPVEVPESPAQPVPTPAELAARIAPKPTTITRPDSASQPGTAARTARPRPTAPQTIPAPLTAPATDNPVTAPGPAQPMLPLVDPAQLARATEVARQYRTDNGTPITAVRLAVALQVSSKYAAQLLELIELGPDAPHISIPTVNGSRAQATR